MKIAIIGGGNIGSSLALALKDKHDVKVTSRSERTASQLREKGLAVSSNKEAISWADVVIISVKPFQFPNVLRDGSGSFKDKVIVSVMAGLTRKFLMETTGGKEVFRAMPNLGITIRKSLTALAGSGDHANTVEEIFSTVGKTFWIDEHSFDAWTALAGSGPGIVAQLVESLALGGVKSGLPMSLSLSATLDVIETTVELLRNEKPSTLRDKVSTPGGTTIQAISVLKESGAEGAIMRAIYEASVRSREISREMECLISKTSNEQGN